MSPDEIRARIDRLVEALLEELRQIDAEAGAKREEAMKRSGLPAEFLEQVLGPPPPAADPGPLDSRLTSAEDYEQNERMSSNEIATPGRKRGRPLESSGPIAAWARTMELSMDQVAVLLSENVNSVRTWDRRVAEGKGKVRLPADVEAKFQRLTKSFRKVDE